MSFLGLVPEAERSLLRSVLAAGREEMADAWVAATARREIFWINLWQKATGPGPLPWTGAAGIDRWARNLADQVFAGESVVCDGYGYIVNPVGSRAQPWHIDYTGDYANIFIPLSRLTPENCTEYCVLPANVPASVARLVDSNPQAVDLAAIVDVCDYVSVRQLLARPFSIIKLNFGTIHRGIANSGDHDRIIFFISLTRGRIAPGEPDIEVAHETKGASR